MGAFLFLYRDRKWKTRTVRLRSKVSSLRQELDEAGYKNATLETSLQERDRLLAEMQAQVKNEFQALATETLEVAQRRFLDGANGVFEHHNAIKAHEAKANQTAFNALLEPMKETLTRYEHGLAELRKEHAEASGALVGRIDALSQSTNNVQEEARRLSNALTTGSKAVGTWGEEQLRNVVEISGMVRHVDYIEQATIQSERSRQIPDMLVRLPGDRVIAVDAKVSVKAFLNAMGATDDIQKAEYLSRHANDLWTHVKSLSAKDYADALEGSIDAVIMFIPGENYLAAAVDERPTLFQEAFERKVLLATPTTLLAILKSISFTWQQDSTIRHAEDIALLSKELYTNLRTMVDRFDDLGRSLTKSVDAYNVSIGALQRKVLPKAQKLSELDIPGTTDPLPLLKQVDSVTRHSS